MVLSDQLRLFWGKARPIPGAQHPWHAVVDHGLDVAAVGAVLLRRRPAVSARLRALLGWPGDLLKTGVPALLALHDIGKLTRPFQAKVPELWPVAALGPIPTDPPADPGHGATGLRLLLALEEHGDLALLDGWRPIEAELLLGAFLGHHGRPVAPDERLTDLELYGAGRRVLDAAAAHVELVRALFGLAAAGLPAAESVEAATWPLAGLAALADWIGSRQEWFPYTADTVEPASYWREHALPRAEAAVDAAGLEPAPVRLFGGLAALAGPDRVPSPVQAWAETVELPEGPLLILVEDVTGSGKTEAALVLAHRLMASGHAAGMVVALPTMATANAMFARLGAVYRRLFAEGAVPSLALAHGRADLHPGFRAAVRITGATPDGDAERRGDAASAECAAWLADDRRKAFLADVGVATVDQAILAMLPAKHQPVRLLGLAERVLVVDEAHAYDAYVTTELEELLGAHAANGGSAVLLSATLPANTRRRLVAAFSTGIERPPPSPDDTAYPLATLVAGAGVAQTPLPTRAELVRRVRVERLADAEAALAAVVEAAHRGAAVAWVRNTVDDALDAADRVRALGPEPLLFHARFAMGDRLAVEAQVLQRFGAGAGAGAGADRRRGVLIATQVVEQSLDVDFDLVISDLAPVDLLLQRMGRLWRHPARDPRRPVRGPRLLVVSPDPVDRPAADWVASPLRGTALVYPDHALLWRSARSLFRRGEVRVPEDVRALVEEAYGAAPEVPDALAGSADRVRGSASAQTWVARTNTLDLAQGYTPSSGQWAAEHLIPTRDAEDQVTFRLGRVEEGRIVPWHAETAADAGPRRAWALSEVKVRRSRASAAVAPAGVPPALVERTRATWPEHERSWPLLVLEKNDPDDAWHGQLIPRGGRPVLVTYRVDQGLRFSS
jgi:CRISPR-associated endonuclease/helicase Cas3